MSHTHQKARALYQRIQYDLGTLEVDAQQATEVVERLAADISELEQLLKKLKALIQYDGIIWQERVNSLASECREARAELNVYMQKTRTEAARSELLAGSLDIESGNAMEMYMQERDSIDRSHGMVDGYIQQASESLGMLRDQRSTLKGVQRALYSMSNTLGLSQGVMRVASRRNLGDKVAVYGGMVFTLIFLWFMWSWASSRRVMPPLELELEPVDSF